MTQEAYPISPEKLAELHTAYYALQNLLHVPSGQPAMSTRYEVAKFRLGDVVETLIEPWPVPVSDAQIGTLTDYLTQLRFSIESVGGQRTGRLESIVKLVEQGSIRLEYLRVRIIATAQSALAIDLEGKRNEIQSSIDALNEIAKDKVNKHSLEQQSTYYSEQAIQFRGIALASLGVFIVLCAWFANRLHSYQGPGAVISDYIAQDSMLAKRAHEEHPFTKAQMGTIVERLTAACPDCMRSLFINALVKANAIRIVEVSFLLFLIAVALRVFNSSAHNYTINMQRSNSLRAALQLLDRSHSNEAKDAMMDKAASAIFAHQPSGFNAKPPSNLVQSAIAFGKSTKQG